MAEDEGAHERCAHDLRTAAARETTPHRETGATRTLSRRAALATGAGILTTAVAGCTSNSNDSWELPDSTSDAMVSQMPAPKMGQTNGANPTRIVAFTDFMCPHCADWHRRVLYAVREEVIKPGKAVLVHRDFPIPVSKNFSWPAAYAARAVYADNGAEGFWSFADHIYHNQDDVTSLKRLVTFAEKYGANSKTVRKRIKQQTYYPVVKGDRKDGKKKGVSGTPTIFVAGNKVDTPSAENIIKAVRSHTN